MLNDVREPCLAHKAPHWLPVYQAMWHTRAAQSETELAGRVHSLTTSTNVIAYVRDRELVVLDKICETSPTP